MRRPLDRISAAGDSLVGTLLALGLLLVMVTTGVALMTTTEGRAEPVSDIRFQPATFTHCPAELSTPPEDPATLRCATVAVTNQGQAAGIVRCELIDSKGAARFDLNGAHVYSHEMAPGSAEDVLVLIEGVRTPSLPAVGCTSAPLPLS